MKSTAKVNINRIKKWFAAAVMISAASTQVHAADREDVVAGVMVGAVAGYLLANADHHVVYRQNAPVHQHNRYCEHAHYKYDKKYGKKYGWDHNHHRWSAGNDHRHHFEDRYNHRYDKRRYGYNDNRRPRAGYSH